MMDTRVKVEGLIGPNQSLLEYYEREDTVLWCLTEDKENYNILRIEGDEIDHWVSFTFENDAQESFNNIVQEFTDQEVKGDCQAETPKIKSVELSTLAKINNSDFGKFGHTLISESTFIMATMLDETTGKKHPLFIEGEEVRDTLDNFVPQASVSELIDTMVYLLDRTDLVNCYYQPNKLIANWKEMSNTGRICGVYDLYIKSSNKRECLELVASPFFQAMTEDYQDSAARESLDYLLSLLVK